MQRGNPLLIALAGLAGAALVAWLLWSPAPSDPPTAAGGAGAGAGSASPSDGAGPSATSAAGRGRAGEGSAGGPAGERPDYETAVAEWRATEPIALHAERDIERWQYVADRLLEAGETDLSVRARTVALRLDRARQPVVAEEARAALIEEVEVLRQASRLARDELQDEALLLLLQDVEQGAHAALQGAPPPEPQVSLP